MTKRKPPVRSSPQPRGSQQPPSKPARPQQPLGEGQAAAPRPLPRRRWFLVTTAVAMIVWLAFLLWMALG